MIVVVSRDIQHQAQSISQAPRGIWGKSGTLANKNAIENISFLEILCWHGISGFQDTSLRILPQKFCAQSQALTENLSIKYVNVILHYLENEIKAKPGKGRNNSQHQVMCDSGKRLICTKACKHREEKPHHHFPWHGIQGKHPDAALMVSLVELQ